jgi:hypothetical protein
MWKEGVTIVLMHRTFICVTEQPYRLLVTVFRLWIEIRMWSFRMKLDVSFISRALPLVRSYCTACFIYFTFCGHIMSTVTYHLITFLMSVWLCIWRGKGTAHVAEVTVHFTEVTVHFNLLYTSAKSVYTSPKLLYTSAKLVCTSPKFVTWQRLKICHGMELCAICVMVLMTAAILK